MSKTNVNQCNDTYRFPAEFEPHRAIWMGWPVYENKKGLSTIPVMLQIIKELAPYVNVRLAVQDDEEKHNVIRLFLEHKIPLSHVSFYVIPHNDIWFRDMGPIFLKNNEGNLKIVDFNFSMWGYEDSASESCIIDRQVARLAAKYMNLDIISTEMISEGGDWEFNGKGTMIIVKTVELQRNMGMTIPQMEVEFKKIFKVRTIIWLEQGIYEDDHAFLGQLPGPNGNKNICTPIATGGHIDEFCRFVSADTLLLAEVTEEEAAKDPIARENRKRLEKNHEILKKAVDQDGNPFKIKRISLPEPLFTTMSPGDGVYDYIAGKYGNSCVFPIGKELKFIAAASYLNYLVTNGVVLAPKYWRAGMPKLIKDKDETAVEILREVFPGRKIITLDTMAINWGGGGIHCITQQEPAVS